MKSAADEHTAIWALTPNGVQLARIIADDRWLGSRCSVGAVPKADLAAGTRREENDVSET